MKNTLKLHLYGYTVRGTDRRDGTDFEDFTVMSDMDGKSPTDRINKIIDVYNSQGFDVDKNTIFPDDPLEKSQWKNSPGIEIELDFIKVYRLNQKNEDITPCF